MIICPRCEATTRQIKAGKTKAGLQRYRCMHCKWRYIPAPEQQSHITSVPEQSIPIEADAPAATVLFLPEDLIEETKPTLVVNALEDVRPETETMAVPVRESKPTLDVDVETSIPLNPTFPMKDLQPTLISSKGQYATTVVKAYPNKRNFGLLGRRVVDWAAESNAWGLLPEIAVLQSAGLLLIAWTFLNARAIATSSELFLWVSLTIMILPTAFRLASADPTRRERIGLVLLLGMSLYLVKIIHSPIAFTFPDELSHMRNVTEILETHHLFQENPVQPVTALYPGLPTVTSTLISLSGLPISSAGFLVIGAARLIVFLALFLLYEQVSGSSRIAGLATLLYMANPNFLFWTSEYAYEPLALPIVALVLLAVAKREMAGDRRHHTAWTIVAIAGMFTVIITHHMSSYILTAILLALTAFSMIRSRGRDKGPWDLALIALLATSSWLIFVARMTINYLSPVLLGAVKSIFHMISEEEQGRQLFKSGSSSRVTPVWEQLVAVGSVIMVAFGLPFGAWEIWNKYRNKIFAILLTGIALVYLPMQLLRFTKAGWETANRSSEFLFMGIAFVIALGIVNFWLGKWSVWVSKTVYALLAVVLFFGGVIAGWPPKARMPRPYLVYTSEHLIQPQVVSVAEWMATNLGPDNRIAASKADAKVIGAYGQYPFTGNAGGIRDMFLSDGVGPSERGILSRRNIKYIVSDRKEVSWDHMIGYFFYNNQFSPSQELELIDRQIFEKFDGLVGVNRMIDSGDIVVYDVEMYLASNKDDSDTGKTKSPAQALHTPLPAAHMRSGMKPSQKREARLVGSHGNLALLTPAPLCTWTYTDPSNNWLTTAEDIKQTKCVAWRVP